LLLTRAPPHHEPSEWPSCTVDMTAAPWTSNPGGLVRRLLRQLTLLIAAGALVSRAAPVGAQQGQPAQAQTGSITGTVTDQASRQPLPAARVFIVGTTRGVETNDEGRYRLGGLAAGTYQVRVTRIGFESTTQSVTVAAGQPATADFALRATAVTLEQVTITATGEQIRTKETGNVVSSIDPEPATLAAVEDITDLLTARSPGVYVQQSSGTAGVGSRIRIRGANSVSLTNEPLLVVDGIRANNDVGNRQIAGGGVNTGVGTGGQVVSRLNDINPEDIESIEVIKGPAGVALYGTAAANGVIQITTKKGRAGRTQWRTYGERRGLDLGYYEFPANYAMQGTLANGTATTNCNIDARTRGACTPTEIASFNPLETYDPRRSGFGYAVGGNASGGTERVTYFFGLDTDREEGVLLTNDARRSNLRANVRGQLRDNWDLAVNTGYVTSEIQLPVNDNSTLGIISTGLLGRAFDHPTGKGYFNNFSPDQLYNISNRQFVDRVLTSATSNLQATSWLSFSGVAGLDYIAEVTRQALPPNRVAFGDLIQGNATSNTSQVYNWTAQGNGTASFDRGDWRFTTQLGAQFAQERFRGTNAFGAVLTAGTGSLSGTSSRFAVSEFNTDNVTIGGFASQQLAFRDRVFINAALRGDDNSAFGTDFGFIFYPAVNASWVLSEESFFPRIPGLSSFRLRGAMGHSGQRPQFRNAITFYVPVAVRVNDTEVGAVTFGGPVAAPGGVGNLDLKPERTVEYEGGFDASLLNERVNVQLTYFTKTTEDALIQRPIAPSVGAAINRFENIGSMRNRGLEMQISSMVIDTRPVRLDLTLNGSTLDNELLELGEGIAPISFNSGRQFFRNGYPAGGYFQRPILSYADLNGDGMLSRVNCRGEVQRPTAGPCEVVVGDTNVFLGNPLPKRELQFVGRLGLFNNMLRVQTLIDHKGDFKTLNLTNRFRCAFVQNCRAIQDPSSALVDQAAAIAAIMAVNTTDAGYVEDGDFTRLRELSVTLAAPADWARRLRMNDLSLTVAGRNLHVWTKYKGLDPEVTSTPGANFTSSDFLTVPPVRTWTARVNLSF
jgi:TonB-linked SusC/RagA family outer membrane protein